MRAVSEILSDLRAVTDNIPATIQAHRDKGRKVIGVFPIYAPEELVYATGMLPVGCWGGQTTISQASKLLPPCACPVMQSITERCMTGGYGQLDGAILSAPCDTLKCFTQNITLTNPDLTVIYCLYPQNNRLEGGVQYLYQELKRVGEQLEHLSGVKITDSALKKSIAVYNENRAAMMALTSLLQTRHGLLTPTQRYTVMKSRWFMDKAEHTVLVRELCLALEALDATPNAKRRVVLAGIMSEPTGLVQVLEELGFTVAADELAYESRQFRNPVPAGLDQYERLARQWQNVEGCSFACDTMGKRGAHIVELARAAKADGVIYCQMKFCEAEEFDYPYIQRLLAEAGIPILNLEVDPLSASQEQSRTRLQAFGEQLEMTL